MKPDTFERIIMIEVVVVVLLAPWALSCASQRYLRWRELPRYEACVERFQNRGDSLASPKRTCQVLNERWADLF